MLDQSTIIAAYNSSTDQTIPMIAAQFETTPAIISAILKLHGIKPRRGGGNPNGPSEEARRAGAETRRNKALIRAVASLVETHGAARVQEVLSAVVVSQDIEADASA